MVGADRRLARHGGRPAVRGGMTHNWPEVDPVDEAAVMAVLRAKRLSFYSSTKEIDGLERKFEKRLARPFALALNSGTSALYVAFLCLGLEAGDEVLVPTYTFPATVVPLLHTEATLVFYDTAPNCPVPDLACLSARVSARTRAVVVSHMDGYPAPMLEIMAWARLNKLLVVEDCAQALGAKREGFEVGMLGDMAAFSFTEKKIAVGGEGGLLVMSDRGMYERAVLLSYLQKRSMSEVTSPALAPFCYTGLGFNFRMHPFAAALASSQLDRIDKQLAERDRTRRAIETTLSERSEIRFPAISPHTTLTGGYSIKMLVDAAIDSAEYAELLACEGVPCVRSETVPLHMSSVFSRAGAKAVKAVGRSLNVKRVKSMSNAEDYFRRAIRLPPLSHLDSRKLEQLAFAFDKVGRYLTQERRSAML